MTFSDPIAAIERAPNRIQGMVRSIDQYRNGDPKAILAGSEAQALYALTDARHDVLVLWDFAVTTGNENVSLARQAAEMKSALVELTDAAGEMLKGLDARIQAAPGNAIPVYHGIVDLSDAFHRARSLTTEISDAGN